MPAGVSLSARRAWIEIPALILDTGFEPVALRKESVDRNSHLHDVALEIIGSLSARRAWIEIWAACSRARRACGRSPQGERG